MVKQVFSSVLSFASLKRSKSLEFLPGRISLISNRSTETHSTHSDGDRQVFFLLVKTIVKGICLLRPSMNRTKHSKCVMLMALSQFHTFAACSNMCDFKALCKLSRAHLCQLIICPNKRLFYFIFFLNELNTTEWPYKMANIQNKLHWVMDQLVVRLSTTDH